MNKQQLLQELSTLVDAGEVTRSEVMDAIGEQEPSPAGINTTTASRLSAAVTDTCIS